MEALPFRNGCLPQSRILCQLLDVALDGCPCNQDRQMKRLMVPRGCMACWARVGEGRGVLMDVFLPFQIRF